MGHPRAYTIGLGLAALIVMVGCVIIATMQILTADSLTPAVLLSSLITVLLGVGLSSGLLGLAMLIRKPQEMSLEVIQTLHRIQTQVQTLGNRLEELHLEVVRRRPATPVETTSGAEPIQTILVELRGRIEELHELATVPEDERRRRFQAKRQQYKLDQVQRVFDLVAAQEFAQAERIIVGLESEFPGDDKVAQVKHHLSHFRALAEQEAVAEATTQVEELMSIAAWDDALARAQRMVGDFPDNLQARDMLERVRREREAYIENTARRMYEEARAFIERREWRSALRQVERIIQQFPGHPRANRLAEQLDTLRQNAEIEERQELEVRMETLIKSRRFAEAIELGEEIQRRYPHSPQAEVLETMLPRLRQMLHSPPVQVPGNIFQSSVEIGR